MNFVRGQDVKESMGIGVFSPIIKEVRERILLDLSGTEFWTNIPLGEWEVPKATFKSFPNKNNVNKLIVFLEFNKNPISEVKDLLELSQWSIKSQFEKNNCKVFQMNYYTTEKYCRKYEFEPDEDSSFLIMEIAYSIKK
jgi:hypothetical protein